MRILVLMCVVASTSQILLGSELLGDGTNLELQEINQSLDPAIYDHINAAALTGNLPSLDRLLTMINLAGINNTDSAQLESTFLWTCQAGHENVALLLLKRTTITACARSAFTSQTPLDLAKIRKMKRVIAAIQERQKV